MFLVCQGVLQPRKGFEKGLTGQARQSFSSGSGDGKVITKFNAPAALKTFEANQNVYRSLLDPEGITSNYNRFHDQLQKAASSQQYWSVAGKVGKVGAHAVVGGGIAYEVYKHYLQSLLGL